LKLKCTKFDFLTGFQGPTSKGLGWERREGKIREGKKERKGRGERRKEFVLPINNRCCVP